MSNIKIHQFTESDWATYKSIRLASLNDSPESFGSTYEREAAFSIDEWKSRINPGNGIAHVLPLVAKIEQASVGLASGVVHEPDCVHVYQMWVSPEYRGRGVGQALLNQIRSWAQELQLSSLFLAVTTTNIAAINMYTSFGFVPYGELEPLRKGSQLTVQSMVLKLK